jgi:hypothetical protein
LKINIAVLLFLIVLPASAVASVEGEIKHLLNFVKKTECKYERNGTFHNGVEAANHINKKYAYFTDNIKSTEDFIKYSATKSTFSGVPYKIHCTGKPSVKSKSWLLTELMTYREKQQ